MKMRALQAQNPARIYTSTRNSDALNAAPSDTYAVAMNMTRCLRLFRLRLSVRFAWDFETRHTLECILGRTHELEQVAMQIAIIGAGMSLSLIHI